MPKITTQPSQSLEASLRHYAQTDLTLAAEIRALEIRREAAKSALFDLLMAEGKDAAEIEMENGEIAGITISGGETRTLVKEKLIEAGVSTAQIDAATKVTPRAPSVRVTLRRRGSRE